MNTKLTLNLNTEVIHEAKTYAKSHKVSLSKLIENYLNSLTRAPKKKSSVLRFNVSLVFMVNFLRVKINIFNVSLNFISFFCDFR
jgi:hypothetical protein